MRKLPDEIWVQICDCLDPSELLRLQRVSKRLCKLARDASLWKAKCFEKAPSGAHAFANGDSLSEILNKLSLQACTKTPQDGSDDVKTVAMSRRARAIIRWDCTSPNERIDWYSEYIGRHAPLSAEWQHHPTSNEIRSMAMFDNGRKVLSAMEDGSLRIWDISTSSNGYRNLQYSSQSSPGVLFTNFSSESGPSKSSQQPSVGTAIDSTLVHHSRDKAYVSVEDTLNEIDLHTLSVISQQKLAWKITAISQQSNADIPLMIGTSFTLNMHDPRMPLRQQSHRLDSFVDMDKNNRRTVFLPNYAKDWPGMRLPQSRAPTPAVMRNIWGQISGASRQRIGPEAFAPVEPGPQTILHRGENEILVAGRMPSILFYDRRSFPRLESVIHSGARLSSITALEQPPRGATGASAKATLVAAGEYHGRGSLEIYELPHQRPSDRRASYDWPEEQDLSSAPAVEPTTTAADASASLPDAPFAYRNRQSSSSAKLLSVATQGARIVFSDSEGGLKWIERDGRGLARRWNINSYEYTQTSGAVIGESVARKILTFPSDEYHSSGKLEGMVRGNGDLLVWTGSEIGIVTSKVKWTGHDELVAAFEEKLSLEDSPEGVERRKSVEETRQREDEYNRTMRRALERQADERRFLARFGRMGGW